MRLVLVVPEFGGYGGGIHTFYRPLVQRWARDHECFVVVGGASVAEPQEQHGRHVDGYTEVRLGVTRLREWHARFSRYRLIPTLQASLAASWALQELSTELSPDMVEVCDFGLSFVAWIVRPAAPYVVQLHGSSGQIGLHDPMVGQELQALVFRLIEASLLPLAPATQTSTLINQAYWNRVAGMRPRQILPAWAPDGQPTDVLACQPREVESVFRIFGRLQRWKGAETVAKALEDMGHKAPKMEWYGRDMPFGYVGRSTGDYLGDVYSSVFGDKFRWFGQIPQQRIYELQATALCNVIPSTWDVLNFTVIEAMVSGRPVICSRGAGASELIEDGKSGLLFDAGDVSGLAGAMQRMLAMSEAEREQLAAVARATIRDRLEPDRNAAERLEAYQAAIAAWQTPRPPLPEWLVGAVSPESDSAVAPWPMLDNLPLKGLLAYTGRRFARRLAGRR